MPETAQGRRPRPSAVLIPGLVAAETGLGVVSADDERALTPEVRAIDGFDPFADFEAPLSGGVTTVQLSPGRSRLMPGRGAVVKLAGPDPTAPDARRRGRPPRPPRARGAQPAPHLRAAAPARLARPADRPDPAAARLQPRRGRRRPPVASSRPPGPTAPRRPRATDPLLDPLAEALADTGRLRVTAPGAAEIRAALALAREFDLKLLLVEPGRAATVPRPARRLDRPRRRRRARRRRPPRPGRRSCRSPTPTTPSRASPGRTPPPCSTPACPWRSSRRPTPTSTTCSSSAASSPPAGSRRAGPPDAHRRAGRAARRGRPRRHARRGQGRRLRRPLRRPVRPPLPGPRGLRLRPIGLVGAREEPDEPPSSGPPRS